MAVIYRHLKPCGEVFYIGIGKSVKRAYSKHHRNPYWHNVVNKYGYEVDILKFDLSWEEACELEIILIDWYKRADCCGGTLVNLTDGGGGATGLILSQDVKDKHKENAINRNQYLHIAKWRLGRDLTGKNSHMYGKKLPQETRDKLREANIGRIVTQDIRDRIGNSNRCGNNKKSEKVINPFSKEVYNCIGEASIAIGVNRQTLTQWLRGSRTNKSDLIYLKDYDENKNYEKYTSKKYSKYKHITKNIKTGKWYINYRNNKKYITCKYFNTEDEAYYFMINHPLYEKRN